MRFTKNEKYVLDSVDESIIRCLTANARATMTELSEYAGRSRGAISERITAMEEAGVIQNYTVIIDWDLVES